MLFSSISLQQDLRTEESYEIPARSFAVTQPRRSSFSIKMQSANSPAIDSSPCTPAALIPSIDSTAAWEVRRAAWLAPRSNGIPDGGKRKRLRELLSGNGGESGTANRLRTLEELLENSIELSLGNGRENASEESSGITGRAMERGTSAQASGSASPAVTSESKGKKVATILRKASHAILRIDDEPIPDDGFPIRQSDKAREVNVDRASEAILAAFRQGRLLKDALPLALVVSRIIASRLERNADEVLVAIDETAVSLLDGRRNNTDQLRHLPRDPHVDVQSFQHDHSARSRRNVDKDSPLSRSHDSRHDVAAGHDDTGGWEAERGRDDGAKYEGERAEYAGGERDRGQEVESAAWIAVEDREGRR